MDQKENRDIIEAGIRSDFYKIYYVPMLDELIEAAKTALVSCSLEEVKEVQGKIKILTYLKRKPHDDLRR